MRERETDSRELLQKGLDTETLQKVTSDVDDQRVERRTVYYALNNIMLSNMITMREHGGSYAIRCSDSHRSWSVAFDDDCAKYFVVGHGLKVFYRSWKA